MDLYHSFEEFEADLLLAGLLCLKYGRGQQTTYVVWEAAKLSGWVIRPHVRGCYCSDCFSFNDCAHLRDTLLVSLVKNIGLKTIAFGDDTLNTSIYWDQIEHDLNYYYEIKTETVKLSETYQKFAVVNKVESEKRRLRAEVEKNKKDLQEAIKAKKAAIKNLRAELTALEASLDAVVSQT